MKLRNVNTLAETEINTKIFFIGCIEQSCVCIYVVSSRNSRGFLFWFFFYVTIYAIKAKDAQYS